MSKVDNRELSCFFCRELFILYVEEALDASRKALVDTHLASCKVCPPKLEKLLASKKTVLLLKEIHPSNDLIALAKLERNEAGEFFDRYRWKRWPATLQWAAELCVVALALAVTIHLFPWLNLAKSLQHVNLFEQKQTRKDIVAENNQPAIQVPSEKVHVAEEEPKTKAAFIGPTIPQDIKEQMDEAASTDPGVMVSVKGPQAKISESDGKPVVAKSGFLWRGTVSLANNSPEVIQDITSKLLGMGAVRAGKVELGWQRESGQYYYHFIMKELFYDELISFLKKIGSTDFAKETHPREVKEGYIRVIMTVMEPPKEGAKENIPASPSKNNPQNLDSGAGE